MPPRNIVATRDGDVSSEDDLVGASSRAIPKKATKKTTNTKTATKRKAPTKQSRQALQDRTNVHNGAEVNETAFGSDDEDGIIQSKTKRAKTEEPAVIKKSSLKIKAANDKTVVPAKINRVQEKKDISIPGTQQEETQVDRTTESSSTNPPHLRAATGRAQIKSKTPPSTGGETAVKQTYRNDEDVQRIEQHIKRTEREQSVSQKEKDIDRALIDTRTNFDRLKAAADRKSAQADALVSSLKQEIELLRATLRSNASQAKDLKLKADEERTRSAKLLVENTRLAAQTISTEQIEHAQSSVRIECDKLAEELSSTREQYKICEVEKKALEAKLAAARQQLVKGTKSPRGQSARATGINTTEAQREASKKENLYTDLTGLIIRGVKQKNGEDQFDCIQTGRNGTLHFHLTIMNEADGNPKTPGGQSYEDVEFAYEPFLDESRDKELLDLLPEYLAEEICFPRNHAVKFYTKVVESMTRRVTVEE